MELTTSKVTSGQTASSKNAQGSPAVKQLRDQEQSHAMPTGRCQPARAQTWRDPGAFHLAGRRPRGGGLTIHLGHGPLGLL